MNTIFNCYSVVAKTTPAETALKKVLGCHISEWRRLNDLLTDASAEELREAALIMSEDDRSNRLAEINTKREKLDVGSAGICHSGVCIFHLYSILKLYWTLNDLICILKM